MKWWTQSTLSCDLSRVIGTVASLQGYEIDNRSSIYRCQLTQNILIDMGVYILYTRGSGACKNGECNRNIENRLCV